MSNVYASAFPSQKPATPPTDASSAQRSAATLLSGVGSPQELLQLLGVPAWGLDPAWPAHAVPVMRVQADGTLLHEGSRSGTLYVVRSGSFKVLRVQEDGYEQVLTFAQQGELLGCEALYGGARQSTVVALEVTTVYALATDELRGLQQRWPQIEDALCQGLSRQLARASETAEMMVAVASEVRLARFILWLAARMTETGQSGTRLRLRMGRRDIASMLGVAHETVSRSFGTLADAGYLRVDNRDVDILDLRGLQARARNTRASVGEHASRLAAPRNYGEPATSGWWTSAAAPQPS